MELTLLASSRRASGLSVLHGLIKVPLDKVPSSIASRTGGGDGGGRDYVFLVFEYARKSLAKYLEEVLKGTEEDWNIIVDRFQDLAHSIRTIHGYDIVHR